MLHERTVVCGTEPDETPASASTPLTPEDFGIPRRSSYSATQLAAFMEDEPSARTWERECERGGIRATKIGGVWRIPYAELLRYFLSRSNVISMN